ncbi:MAG: VanZ family protein, partial [Actinobacteria bacterium]|nr:VanZ family protein [Actinomycetota bacterium]
MFDHLPFTRPSAALVVVDITIFTVFVTAAITWTLLVRARTHDRATTATHGLFAGYLVVLGCVVFLPLHGVRAAIATYDGTRPLVRAWAWGLQVHTPFTAGHLDRQRIANVVLTIPFGFFFALLAPRLRYRRIAVACLVWAASLELAQLTISVVLGFVYRTFDINDVIDNTIGAWIGLALYAGCAPVARRLPSGAEPTDPQSSPSPATASRSSTSSATDASI